MDAKSFLAEFKFVASTPNGVVKLREMILDFAIKGKLTGNISNSEDVSKLLLDIAAYRKQLVLDGEIKRTKPLPDLKSNHFPFSIPKEWCFERLGNVCNVIRGITFPASQKQLLDSADNIACLRTANIQSEVDWSDLIYVDPSFVKREDQWVKQGDTLISMANSYELVGKVSLVRDVKTKSSFGGFISVARPFLIEPEFLFILLRSSYMQNAMRSTASQTTNIANISLKGVLPIPIPIPPTSIQKLIIEKVTELMGVCDKLERQQEQKRQLQNQLRKTSLQSLAEANSPFELEQHWNRVRNNFSILFSSADDTIDFSEHIKELAVKGLLCKSDSNVADLELLHSQRSELLNSYLENKLMRKQKAITVAESDVEYPSNWQLVAFDEIALVTGGVTKGRKLKDRELISCPYLAVANVQRGFLKLTNLKTIDIPIDELEKYAVKPGDLLITEGGDWDKVGRTAIWRSNIENCLHQNHVFKVRVPSGEVLNEWVELVFNSMVGRNYFARASKQTTNLASINMTQLRSFPFPVPPLSQQIEIINIVGTLNKLCSVWKEKYERLNDLSSLFVKEAIANFTGVNTVKKEEPLKVPKTELVSPITLGLNKPSGKDDAPLATLLARQSGKMNANDLWQRFGGEIDAFYAQLKVEVAHGWIAEPETANMLEKDEE
ncbi:restriction endonuclease subunit S [Vibrio parahaemolyticus]|nr:restriction endonuclease subunit S [Vibrio parahaemolyticus]MBM5048995.1 restriction endonuclease subunit S [Vibrio parahaemolyticus]MBM5073996.1 restriction endonuclease subunit S [Vibrio parahaemolyticus]